MEGLGSDTPGINVMVEIVGESDHIHEIHTND
jgi:hypothetical protein